LPTGYANLDQPSDNVAQTLGRTIGTTVVNDRFQSLDVEFLDIQPVEKFGIVMSLVSIFHLIIQLYFYRSMNGDNFLSR
jgi:hypothetical protein